MNKAGPNQQYIQPPKYPMINPAINAMNPINPYGVATPNPYEFNPC